jgi:hypothetical protein
VKNDERDALDLVDMFRVGRVAPGVDRATCDSGASRAGALSGQVGRTTFGTQSADARGEANDRVVPTVADMSCQAGDAQL